MIIQQKCPICDGTGNVQGGFYTSISGHPYSSTVVMEACRNCIGGVVYVKQEDDEEAEAMKPYYHKTDSTCKL